MARELDYDWRLRLRMAERGIFTSKPLVGLLAEHGIALSESQVWRLVTGKPERLNLHVLVVLFTILDCTPNDLIYSPYRQGMSVLPPAGDGTGPERNGAVETAE